MNTTIALIGAGNMAEALIRGLLAAKAARLVASDVRAERLEELRQRYGIETYCDNARAAAQADIVVLAVKPQQMSAVLQGSGFKVQGSQLVISIAAGVTTERIERELGGAPRVVRTMPNTPALVGAGATAICKGRFATDADLETTETLFKPIGIVVRVEEKALDAVTALSGSGPAYVFSLTEAMIAAGIEAGLSSEVAARLAVQTVFGAGTLLAASGEPPEVLRKKVTSAGGTTEAALRVMSEARFAQIVKDAVSAAMRRSRELSGS